MRGIPREAYLFSLCCFLIIAATNVLTSLLPVIQDEFAVTYTGIGLIVSSYGIARVCVDLPAGFLDGHIGRPRLASIGIALVVAFSLFGAVSGDITQLVVSRIGTGIGVSLLLAILLSSLLDIAPPGRRASVMSLFQVSMNGGIALYPVIGGVLGAVFGWRSTMLLCAALAVAAGAILLPLLRRIAQPAPPPAAASARVSLRWPTALALAAIFFGVFANMFNRHGFRNTLLPLYAGGTLGLPTVQVATGITAVAAVGLLVAIPGSLIGDRFGGRRIVVLGLLALALGDLSFLLVHDYATFILGAMAVGAGDFFWGSQIALVSATVTRGNSARILGVFRFVGDLGALVGPAALGVLLDAAPPQVAMFATAGLLAASALALALAPRTSPARAA